MNLGILDRLSFRHRILLILLLTSIAIVIALFPFASHTVRIMTKDALTERADELYKLIKQNASNEAQLAKNLSDQRHLVFSRVQLIKPDRTILYGTQVKSILGEKYDPNVVVLHPEVEDAFEMGRGYEEAYSEVLQQDLIYIARAFTFEGKTYVLRTAFPHAYMKRLTKSFEIGLITTASALLLCLLALSFFLINYFTQPIRTIIDAIRPYQAGEEEVIPHITPTRAHPNDDTYRLADTINRLSDRVQNQIKTLVLERNEKEAVLEALNDGVVTVDPDLKITFANETAKALFPVAQGEYFAHNETCLRLLEWSRAHDETRSDTLVLGKRPQKVLQVMAIPMGDKGSVLVLKDLSSHYKALKMTRDFVANASHELKTPITIIRGFAEVLHDNVDLPKEQVLTITEKIMTNSVRMSALIGDLLRLSEIENIKEGDQKPCDLISIIENCKASVQEIYPEATITIETNGDAPFQVRGDAELLEQVFLNLLTNGAKYSDGPASIQVSLKRSGEQMVVTVQDHGIGIPADDLPHIFTRFYTVDKGRSKRVGGTGLGLAIVETIVTKSGGTIDVASEVGKGSTFTLQLPM